MRFTVGKRILSSGACLALLLTVFGFGTAFASPLPSGIQQGSKPSSATAAPQPHAVNTVVPTWVQAGNKYVRVVNFVASIDPALYRSGLNKQTIQTIVHAVATYNKTDINLRSQGTTRSAASQLSRATRGILPRLWPWCPDVVRSSLNWWGWSYWLNNCSVIDLIAGGAAAAIVAGLFSGPGGAIVGLYVVDITWAASQCSNYSAFMDEPWGLIPYFAPGC